jgi:hypothetical protein
LSDLLHVVFVRVIASRIISSFRMQPMGATFLGFPDYI